MTMTCEDCVALGHKPLSWCPRCFHVGMQVRPNGDHECLTCGAKPQNLVDSQREVALEPK